MDAYKIPRLYGKLSPKPLIRKYNKNFVKVEETRDVELARTEEFVLYLLRMYPNQYSRTQDYYAEIMGVAENRISEYLKGLEAKGYILIHKKEKGRSKWYELIKEPADGWIKVSKDLLQDTSNKWRNRLFNINLCHLVLNDVNEIHYTDKMIYERLKISKATFTKNRDRLITFGILEKLRKTKANSNGGYRVDVHALLGMQDPGMC